MWGPGRDLGGRPCSWQVTWRRLVRPVAASRRLHAHPRRGGCASVLLAGAKQRSESRLQGLMCFFLECLLWVKNDLLIFTGSQISSSKTKHKVLSPDLSNPEGHPLVSADGFIFYTFGFDSPSKSRARLRRAGIAICIFRRKRPALEGEAPGCGPGLGQPGPCSGGSP